VPRSELLLGLDRHRLKTAMDLRIEKVVTLMKDDLTQRLPLGKMAQSVNLSPARLCYLFKFENGISAARYLKSLRMKEAAVLLLTTFFSVKEIMVRVGLADESHFVKDFKKLYGLTPTEYRKTKSKSEDLLPIITTVRTSRPNDANGSHTKSENGRLQQMNEGRS